MKDLHNNIKVEQVLDPAVATTTQTSSEIDMQGFESLVALIAVGESGDTLSGSVKWDIKLQHSDTSESNYADVTAAEMLDGVASVTIDDAAEDDVVVKFGYNGGKRYIKAVATKTGTHSNGTPIAMLAVKGHPSLAPTV